MTSTKRPATVPLSSQVGGHAGVLTDLDGDLVFKPALRSELEFYQLLQHDEKLMALLPHVPKFLGTLRLEGEVDESKSQEENIVLKSVAEKKDEYLLSGMQHPSIVLENISHPFSKPNIIDIKLGTVLYGDDASPEKIAHMEKTARDTTSFETGVRITGFQIYDNATQVAIQTQKSYGKSIKAADLPEGIAKCFPVGDPSRKGLSGLPVSSLKPILRAICNEVEAIHDVFSELELRMAGGSLLIVYEGDWARAEKGVNAFEEEVEEEDEDDGDGEEEEEEDEAEEEEDNTGRQRPPYVVKLIDFAHTKVVPGQGPDEGVLLGLKTVLNLLDGRLKEL